MKAINVTQPFLPPLEEFNEYLKEIWQEKWLTNNGRYHQQLEASLCEYLGVENISLFSNGTIALVTALQQLKISGEVITTPYSFVATTHSLWWNNITPVFVDIEPLTFNLDPEKIEAAITPKTSAILATHVYGNPCDVEKIQKIANKHNLKVIYDACHTFGVTINGKSVLNFGDLSIMSFHATKVYHTFEGGAIISRDRETKKEIDNLKNFGIVNETSVVSPGINGKMNEVQAAMGLLQLKYIDENINKRATLVNLYRKYLKNIAGISFLENMPNVRHCYSYFPILVSENEYGLSRDAIFEILKSKNIVCRRYFYPLISQFPLYQNLPSAQSGILPVAESVTEKVICLPLYADLHEEVVAIVAKIITDNAK